MKKLVTIFLVLLLTASFTKLHAQFNQNSWMLLGYSALWYQAGKEKYKQDDNTSSGPNVMNLYMRTGAGIFLLSNMAVGLAMNWQYDLRKYSEGGSEQLSKSSSNLFYAGPFLRYYFWQWQAMLLYGEAMIAFGLYNDVSKYFDGFTSKVTRGLIAAHLLVGMSYFITRSLALDVALGYRWNRYKHDTYISNLHQFMACVGLVFYLGQNGGLTNYQKYE